MMAKRPTAISELRQRRESALGRVIRPIVEGQIRGFLLEHPGILEAVDWYKPRSDKAATFTNSLSKRIVRDLVCSDTAMRLVAALVESSTALPPDPEVEPLVQRERPSWNHAWLGRLLPLRAAAIDIEGK